MTPYANLTDPELLLLIRGSNYSAFDELYERHWLSVYNVAYKRLKNRDLSKEIVQDIFVDIWNKRTIKKISDLLPYLHTAVRYKIYTLLSKNRTLPHFVEPFEAMALSSYNADTDFKKEELDQILNNWLKTLPAKRSQIFKLHFFDDLSTKEISIQLNIPQKTVQNHLNLARHDLKDYLSTYFQLILITLCTVF